MRAETKGGVTVEFTTRKVKFACGRIIEQSYAFAQPGQKVTVDVMFRPCGAEYETCRKTVSIKAAKGVREQDVGGKTFEACPGVVE